MLSEFTAAAASARHAAAFDTRTPGRWIVSHLRCYPVVVVLAVLCQLVSWALFASMPVMIGRAAQVVIDGLGSRELLLAALRLLGVMAGNAAALITAMACAASLGHRLQRDARDELYRGLLGKSQTFHNRQRIGDLVARATDDTRMVNEMINPGLVYLTDLPIGFVVTLTYVLLIDPVLAIVPALYGLAFVAAVRDHMRRVGPALAEQRTQYGRLAAVAEEVITGIEVVKATVREAWERRRFQHAAGLFRDLVVRQGRIEALNVALLAFGILTALALLHGIVVLHAGRIELSGLIAFVGLMALFRNPSNKATMVFSQMRNGIAGARRILAMLTASTELDQNTGGHEAAMGGAIAFERVSFCYHRGQTVLADVDLRIAAGEMVALVGQTGSTPVSAVTGHIELRNVRFHYKAGEGVFDDFSLTVHPGETLALVGHTGSGKSSITKLVARFYEFQGGEILVDGRDIRSLDLASYRSHLGFVTQAPFLFNGSVLDNIRYGRGDADDADWIGTLPDGLATEVTERGRNLSMGQRQLVALSRVLLQNPAVLILDEATASIDPLTEAQVQEGMDELLRERTAIVIAHRLSTIKRADRIVVLRAGAIIEQGTHERLLRAGGHYAKLYNAYFRHQSLEYIQTAPGST